MQIEFSLLRVKKHVSFFPLNGSYFAISWILLCRPITTEFGWCCYGAWCLDLPDTYGTPR